LDFEEDWDDSFPSSWSRPGDSKYRTLFTFGALAVPDEIG
jgi:hypothetical protein